MIKSKSPISVIEAYKAYSERNTGFMLEMENIKPPIKVIGIGGGGCEIVSYLYKYSAPKYTIDYWAFDTDIESLKRTPIPNKLHLGEDLSQGTNQHVAKGLLAAFDSEEQIREILTTATVVFLIAVASGGTGGGAVPYIAKLCDEKRIICTSFVSMPFAIDGKIEKKEAKIAKDNINRIGKYGNRMLEFNELRMRGVHYYSEEYSFEEEDLRLLKEDLKIRESDNPTEYDKINRTMAFMLKGIVITTMTDCQREIYELFEDND